MAYLTDVTPIPILLVKEADGAYQMLDKDGVVLGRFEPHYQSEGSPLFFSPEKETHKWYVVKDVNLE